MVHERRWLRVAECIEVVVLMCAPRSRKLLRILMTSFEYFQVVFLNVLAASFVLAKRRLLDVATRAPINLKYSCVCLLR